jgi:hypothetical protein
MKSHRIFLSLLSLFFISIYFNSCLLDAGGDHCLIQRQEEATWFPGDMIKTHISEYSDYYSDYEYEFDWISPGGNRLLSVNNVCIQNGATIQAYLEVDESYLDLEYEFFDAYLICKSGNRDWYKLFNSKIIQLARKNLATNVLEVGPVNIPVNPDYGDEDFAGSFSASLFIAVRKHYANSEEIAFQTAQDLADKMIKYAKITLDYTAF